MRLEGGRYRFTTEPNLNKVVLEREAAIPDTRVYQLVRDAISAATPEVRDAGMRPQPWVQDLVDIADAPVLTLGVLNFDHRMDGAADTDDAVTTAQRVLEYCGSTFRANKNSAMLVIADGKTLTQARAAARTLAALRDVAEDNQRLKRFNVEQKEILAKRLEAVQERLPQLVVMAYRHLALLGESEGKVALDRVDLGSACVGAPRHQGGPSSTCGVLTGSSTSSRRLLCCRRGSVSCRMTATRWSWTSWLHNSHG